MAQRSSEKSGWLRDCPCLGIRVRTLQSGPDHSSSTPGVSGSRRKYNEAGGQSRLGHFQGQECLQQVQDHTRNLAIFLIGKAHSLPLAPCSAFLRYLMCGLRGTAGGLEGRGWEEGAESGFECQQHPPVTVTTISTPCAPSSILGIGRKEAWVSLLFHLSSSGKGGSNPCG